MAETSVTTEATRKPSFPEEWRELWGSLPLRWAWMTLFAAWVAWFGVQGNSTLGYVKSSSLFSWWAWVYSREARGATGDTFNFSEFLNSDSAHVWLVPFVVLFLLWSRRKLLAALPKRVCWPALGLVVVAVGLHLVGFMVQQTRLSVVAFFVGVYGLMGWCWGLAWMRECFFPFLLFAFCVPLSGEFITFRLRIVSAELATFVSKWLLGLDVFREGTHIISVNGRFQYDVAPACSGIRSLVTLLALTTIFGYLTFSKLWKRFLMVALAAPLAVVGNTVRITTAVLVGEVFGHEAGAKVEQNFGFVTFLIALVVLLLVARWLREDRASAGPRVGAMLAAGPATPASATPPATSV